MLKTILIATTALTLSFAPAFAQEVDGTKFRNVEEGAWYHPIEPEMWAYFGADEAEVTRILTRIETATGTRTDSAQPDTISEYGPGNWIYEFTAAGDAAMERGAHQEALAYYHTASAPHTNDPNAVAALDKAFEAFAAEAETVPGTFRAVEIEHAGAKFGAFVLLPEGKGRHPVLVFSNGSDMSSVTALGYYRTHLAPKGIGMIALDTPGMGASRAYDVTEGNTEKLHVAAVEWAKTQAEIDANNIFVQGVSFGGNAAARVWTQHPDLDLAGVIYTCGPLNAAFMAPPEAYDHFPVFTIDGVKTRLGLETTATSAELAERVRVLSIENVGAFDGTMIDTPLLALNTNADPVAPVDEMDRLLARGTDVERVVFDLPGHCPPHNQREAISSAWMLENLR